jgi:arsenate reductase
MNNKVYYLSSCSTCKRILSELDLPEDTQLQDIKVNPITEEDLDALANITGSYELLFSKRAQLYKQRDLKNKSLSEKDFKTLLLEHYTFLSRPVLIFGKTIFVGSAIKTIEQLKQFLSE